jgi:phosphinothricin acetyltransferase
VSDLVIRVADADDLPAIVAIYNEAIPGRSATAQLRPVTVDQRRAWFAEHDARHPIWVALSDGAVAGWLSLSPWSQREAYAATAEVSVYVAGAMHGRGIGGGLLAHALAAAPRLALDRFVAGIFTHNAPSLRLFRSFGFEEWGVLRGVCILDGVRRDVAFLGRAVGDAPPQDEPRTAGTGR